MTRNADPDHGHVFLQPIASQVLASPAASIVFSSIPQTYNLLRLVVTGASAAAAEGDRWAVSVSGSSSGFDIQAATASSATPAASVRNAYSSWVISPAAPPGDMPAANATAGVAGILVIEIPNYAGTTLQKVGLWRSGYSDAATSASDQMLVSAVIAWRSTAAVTSITVAAGSASLIAGTAAFLYAA